jgi:hypothetical protein
MPSGEAAEVHGLPPFMPPYDLSGSGIVIVGLIGDAEVRRPAAPSSFRPVSVFGRCLIVLVASLSGWGDERSDEYLTAIHAPPDNTPNEPKYF